MVHLGMIHGRFQPFHNGHFDYLKAALHLSEQLIVGITNPEPATVEQVGSDEHRHLPEANPFSYYLRARMIHESILTDGETRNRLQDIIIVPFPVNKPDRWSHYIPGDGVTQFMRLLDPWDHEKRRMFEQHGYEVTVIDGLRITSGSEIRAAISGARQPWHQAVPRGTVSVLQEYFSAQREHSKGG